MFGLYAVLSARTLNGNGLKKRGGGCSFAVPCRIFWRFPVAPAYLHPTCILPASVLHPLFPVPRSRSPFPVPRSRSQSMNKENECREAFVPVCVPVFLCAFRSQIKTNVSLKTQRERTLPLSTIYVGEIFCRELKKNEYTFVYQLN